MLPINDPQTFLLVFLYLGLVFIVGYALICIILKPGLRHWVQLIALSYAIGSGILPLILFVVSIAGFKPSRLILTAIAIVALATIAGLWRKRRLLQATVPSPRGRFDPLSLVGYISAALITTAACNIAARAAWPGLQDIDAFGIWMLKAKWVAIDALRPMPGVFHDPILSYSHQDYPLAFPMLVAGLYAAISHIDDNAAKLILLPTWLSLVGIVYAAVRRIHRRATALAIVAIFATAPTLTSNASLLVVETPLILALAGTVTELLIWIEAGEPGDLVLAGLFAATAAFTKNEGLALLPIFGLMAVTVAIIQKKSKDLVRAAMVCSISILPWLIYRIQLPRTHEDYGNKLLHPAIFFTNLPQRAGFVAQYLGRFFDVPRAGLIWILLVLTSVFSPRAFLRASVRVLWCILLTQLTLYLATFIVTPWDLQVLIPMITPKLQTQASVIAAMLIAMNLRDMRPHLNPALPLTD